MPRNLNTILLKGRGHHEEGEADSAISPGEAIRMASDGTYDPETLAPEIAAARGLMVAMEDALQGKTVDDAYADGDRVFFYIPVPGDELNVLVKAGEDIDIADYLGVEGSGSGKFVEVSSAATSEHKLQITDARVHDGMDDFLPNTAADDDMAIITGTPGTDAPTLQGVDFGGGATDEMCAFEFVIPKTYRAGAPLTVRVKAGMLTTVGSVGCTVDVECWKDAGDGSVGSDLCATAAQDINSLTFANKDFTITPTGLQPGDKLIIRLAFAGSDVGDAGVMIPEIQNVAVLLGDAIAGKLEALEDSGGVLAAATLLRCRVLTV